MWYGVCLGEGTMLSRLGSLLFLSVLSAASLGVAVTSTGCSLLGDDSASSESEVNVAPSPFWKNTLSFPTDPFAVNGGASEPRWVKFTIFVSEQTKVYFQDSNKYAFHYDFAKNHLPGFGNMSPPDFVKATLKKEGQKLITGAVLMPPNPELMEYGVQIIREDEYSKEEVKKLHDLVKSKITLAQGATARVFYMPTFEQLPAANRDRTWLEDNGVTIGSPERWLAGDACYAGGWAFGKAKFFASGEIKQAYIDGRLKTQDILVTDGVPAEVPYVAGIISLAASTPSSHVAILSKTWGIPFVFPKEEASRARLRAMDGKEIALRTYVYSDAFGNEACSLDVVEPKGTIDAQTRADIAALRKPAPVAIPKRTHLGGALTKDALTLKPADVKYFGGKASNFGTLRRTIPNNSPKAVGISFDLWEAFIAQTLASTGKTLQQEIDARIGNLTFPPDMVALEAKLEEIRKLVTDEAVLPATEKTKLLAELQAFGFDPKIKVRFRSSTNVEDGDVLSGAGLYDSYSGCLADDLDTDTAGPSICDAAEAKERGAERAIKKVYASFFNTNAVLERLKYEIKEADVGMALAAHYSYPDEREAANGVATVRLRSFSTTIALVSQLGAESVTNPTGGALPETVTANVFSFGDNEPTEGDVGLAFGQGSTRVQLGGKVMKWEEDYRKLTLLIDKASKAFKRDHGVSDEQDLAIDIEYKKDTDGALVLKQIRQIPEPSNVPSVVPVMLDEGGSLCTSQGEYGNVFANHRLKSRGVVNTRHVKLSDQAIQQPLVTNISFDLVENGAVTQKAGNPTSFVGAAHSVNDGGFVGDAWKSAWGTLTLGSAPDRLVAPSATPLVVARDFRWNVFAKYTSPKPGFGNDGLGEVTSDDALVQKCLTENDVAPAIQSITANGPNGLKVKTEFHYQKANGPFEKTASLGKWVQTEIKGLIATPIVLKGWFSQSFRPGHHNFDESFIFEPSLEENLPPAIKQQLEAKDIQALVMLDAGRFGEPNAKFYVIKKSDGKLKQL
jgi:hypothetical protein